MSSGELGEERKRGEWSERDLSDAYLGGAGDSGDPSPG
jgi:hypothetical protein